MTYRNIITKILFFGLLRSRKVIEYFKNSIPQLFVWPSLQLAYRFDVPVEEPDFVDGLDGPQDLVAESEGRGQTEGAPGLRPPQLCQVLALQLHHHVVKPLVTTATDEPTHVVPPCPKKWSSIAKKNI